jgi:hypothetical protein
MLWKSTKNIKLQTTKPNEQNPNDKSQNPNNKKQSKPDNNHNKIQFSKFKLQKTNSFVRFPMFWYYDFFVFSCQIFKV